MIDQKSKLTLVLKIYSITSLIYAIYQFINFFISCIKIRQIGYYYHYLNTTKWLITIIALSLLIWIIFGKKETRLLFWPYLILTTQAILMLMGRTLITTSTGHLAFSPSLLFDFIVSIVVYGFLAKDARKDSEHYLQAAIAVISLQVLITAAYILSSYNLYYIDRIFPLEAGRQYFLDNVSFNLLSLIFSPAVLIMLYLLRTHFQQKAIYSEPEFLDPNECSYTIETEPEQQEVPPAQPAPIIQHIAHFQSRSGAPVTCPVCQQAQSSAHDFCFNCGGRFVYDSPTEAPPADTTANETHN